METKRVSEAISPQIVPTDGFLTRFLRGYWLAFWVALLLGAFAVQAISSIAQKSITSDEVPHLPAGYSYLTQGDFRLNAEHPPLAKMIAAIPLLFMDINGAFDSKEWEIGSTWDYGWRFLYESGNDCATVLFWGRFAMVMLSLCLGLLVFFWARKLYGNGAGLFALFLFAFSPNLIAHGSLTNTDLAISFFLLLALFCFDRALRRLTVWNMFLAGLTLGLALLTKFSAPLALPIMGAAALARLLDRRPLETGFPRMRVLTTWRQKAPALIALFALMMMLAYAVIWAGYLGRFTARTDGSPRELRLSYPREPAQMGVYRFLWSHRLFPQAFIEGFCQVQSNISRDSFLDGRHNWDPNRPEYDPKWPHYFVMTTLYKTPVPALLFLVVAVAGAFRFSRKTWRDEIIIVSAMVVYFAAASFSGMYIGHRHILPVIPPAMIFISKLAGHLRAPGFRYRVILMGGFALLLVWYLFSAVKIHPNHLAYFNEIAGGPGKGAEHLTDSNIDWGQDLILLKQYMDEQGIGSVHLIYSGNGDPRYYGVRCKFYLPPEWSRHVLNEIPSSELSAAVGVNVGDCFAISVTMLQETWQTTAEAHEVCELFRAQQPLARIGYSIYLFRSPFSQRPKGIEALDRIRFPDRYPSDAATPGRP
jgi:hypothetical protein